LIPDTSLSLALRLAELGWHVLPLSPTTKRPLANCQDCAPPHPIKQCPCIPAGRPCHGVRAATVDPARITVWWQDHPRAVPGIATGPSRLVLLDLDTHSTTPPDGAELLPGIDLAAERIPADRFAAVRDGRDVLLLLAELRGDRVPWPRDNGPVVVLTPSGGRHLWYRAPPGVDLRQAIGELGWQIDIKAGWSYGIAPGAVTSRGTYQLVSGDPSRPRQMPGWLTREVVRVASRRPDPPPPPAPRPSVGQPGPAAYLTTVVERGTADLVQLRDGRQRALSALAYKAGGLLAWSGLPRLQVEDRLVEAGISSGLPDRLARRIVTRALSNGTARPLPQPTSQPRSPRNGGRTHVPHP